MNNALIDPLFKTFSRNILREYLAPVWRLFQLIFRGIIYSTYTGTHASREPEPRYQSTEPRFGIGYRGNHSNLKDGGRSCGKLCTF